MACLPASTSQWATKSLLWDWLAVFVLIVLYLIVDNVIKIPNRFDLCTENGSVEPCNSTSPDYQHTLGQPKSDEIIPNTALVLVFSLVPIFVFAVTNFVRIYFGDKVGDWIPLHDFHNAMLTHFQTSTLTLLVTEFLKRWVGRLRPIYYAIKIENGLGSDSEDVHKSYPSGHASMSFAAMTLVSWYLLGKTKVFHKGPGNAFTTLGCLSFMTIAIVIATSRIIDNSHNPDDVNAGSFIGMVVSTLHYHLNYHPVTHELCQYPRFHANMGQQDDVVFVEDNDEVNDNKDNHTNTDTNTTANTLAVHQF